MCARVHTYILRRGQKRASDALLSSYPFEVGSLPKPKAHVFSADPKSNHHPASIYLRTVITCMHKMRLLLPGCRTLNSEPQYYIVSALKRAERDLVYFVLW